MYYELTDEFVVAADLEKSWHFFSQATNLPKITPPWLRFELRMPAGTEIKDGARLDYAIRWMGVPVKWRTEIIDWQPPRQFIDLQTRGPYTLWHHQHVFEPMAEGTHCRDRVIYKLPVGPFWRIVHAATVRRQLLEIFRFRRKVIGEHLGWVRAVQDDVRIQTL